MKIEQLKLENFKCFKTEKTFDFGKITLLTGANNSGKSTVMQALLSAIQSDGFPLNYSPNGKYVNLGDFKEISHNGNKHPIQINIKTSDENASFFDFVDSAVDVQRQSSWQEDKKSFLPKLKKATLSAFNYDHFDINEDTVPPDSPFRTLIQKSFIETISIDAYEKDLYSIKIQCFTNNIAQYCFDKIKQYDANLAQLKPVPFLPILTGKEITFTMTLNDLFFYSGKLFKIPNLQDIAFNYIGAFRQPPQLNYWETNNYTSEINSDGEGYIDQIIEWEKRSDSRMTTLASTLQSLGLLDGVKINRLTGGKLEVLVKPLLNGAWLPLSQVGYGISQLLPILVADLQLLKLYGIIELDSSTFFLAEPETHLHPSIQSNFAQYIVNQINKHKNKNYVIETHSEYFLNRIRLAIVKGELAASDIRVYFLKSIRNDTNVYNINFTKTGEIQGAPASFFETYAMDAMQIFANAFKE